MKLQLTLYLFLIGFLASFGQNDNYELFINGQKLNTQKHFKKQAKLQKKQVKKHSLENNYLLVQFFKTPTTEEIANLKYRGIEIKSNFSKTAYYAKVKSGFYAKNENNKNLRAVISIEPKHKLLNSLLKGEIPKYALDGNSIKVIITCFEIDENIININLSSLGIKNYRISKDFKQVIANIPQDLLLKTAALNWVQNIELTPPPQTIKNTYGVSSHRANVLQSNISNIGYGLTGKGVKIGLWDANVQKHPDCTGRLVNKEYKIESSHGSHVFGTMAGAGIIDPKAKGMAPEAEVFTWNFRTQNDDGLFVYEERLKSVNEDGIELTQNSFGDYVRTAMNIFRYSADDRGDDQVTVMKPFLLNVYANGNDQSNNAANGGYNTSSKNSKNSLHVGANNHDETISSYSSFGPTADGRIIPQVNGVGTNVYSMIYGNGYGTLSGTSMSTPGVSGTIALLYQQYKKLNNGKKPLASLIKGIVSNTAQDMGNKGPDYQYGFGNINGLRALKVINNKAYFINSVSNNEEKRNTINVPAGTKQLKIMLCYSDLPGVAGSSKILVNDLDLKVLKDGKEYLPWVLNPAKPNIEAIRGVDNLNNIEQVTIDNPSAGNYQIIVKGKHIPLNTQEYAVTYDILTPKLNLTYPIGNEKFNPGEKEHIRWDYIGDDKNFNLEYSTDNGNSYKKIAHNLPSNQRTYVWKVPDEIGNKVKIRIIAGAKVASSKENIIIMKRPKNLTSTDAKSCGVTSFTMNWEEIPNAKYEILKLQNLKEFVKIAETTTNNYSFSNDVPSENNWYTVRAVDLTTGAISERALAIQINPRVNTPLSPTKLPYKENFETLEINEFSFSTGNKKTGYAGLGYYDTTFKNAVLMGGTGVAQENKPWVRSVVDGHGFATVTNAFIDNPTYIKRMKYCAIDATKSKGKKLLLKFDLKYLCPTGSSNKIFFRTLINGTELISTDKNRYYHGVNGDHNPIYDLSAYAGTKFDLTFEAVIDDQIQNAATNQAIILAIDNIIIEEAKNDVATIYGYSWKKEANETTKEVPVTIRIQNFSPNTITDIPVSYTINGGTPVKEVIKKKIPPFNSYNYTFNTKMDLSQKGAYNVELEVSFPNDEKKTNNKFKLKEIINLGTDIVIGASPATEGNPLYTYTTCSASFTDDGTRYGNYKNLAYGSVPKVAVFIPKEKNKKVKIDFSEFDLEKGYDYLKVYNGPDTSSPLLANLTGNELPAPIISTAKNGELTFQFIPDQSTVTKGWLANISCVNPDSKLESQIVKITKPQIINKKTATTAITIVVKNLGEEPRTNLPVFYQINNGTKVEEVIEETITPLEEKEYTFKTTTDMSKEEGNFKYVIKTGVNENDLMPENNTLTRTVYNKYKLPGNVNTDGYSITELSWGEFVNKSGTTGYSNFKDKEITIFKDKLYMPFVNVSKPDVAMSKFFYSASSGIFTIMVIDLNNDGDYSDEFYTGNFWVNTEFTDTQHRSTKTTHFFKKALDNEYGVTIPNSISSGKHNVRLIHMFRAPNENYNVILGPTIDDVNTSRNDFEIEEYTLNIKDKPNADIALVDIKVAPRKNNASKLAITVKNNAKSSISNFDVTYKINNQSEQKTTVNEEIKEGETKTILVNASIDLRNKGVYTVFTSLKLANDTNSSNDSKTITVNHVGKNTTNYVATFFGKDDYVASQNSSNIDLTNNYTFETWVHQTKEATVAGGGLPRIIDKNTVKIFINNSATQTYNKNSFVCYFLTDKGEYILNTQENTTKLNEWQHFALTVSANNDYKLFINGALASFKLISTKNSTTVAGPAKSNASDKLFIGNQKAKDRGFEGYIDEVRIWKGARTQQQILNNLTQSFTGKESNIIAYYPINEQLGSYIFDYSNSDNTASIKNTDVNGTGNNKFWNIPKLLKGIKVANQIESNYNELTKTYTIQLPKDATATSVVLDYDLQMQSIVKIGNVTQSNNVTANNFTNPVTITVEGVGFNKGLTETYTVKILAGLNDKSELLSYNILKSDNQSLTEDINTTINGVNVEGEVDASIDRNNLIATFTISSKASLYINDVKQESNKTSSLNYKDTFVITVVSENKQSQTNYEVSLKNKTKAKSLKKLFSIYPNPVTENEVNIISNLKTTSSKTVYVYTLSGNQLNKIETTHNAVNLSDLSDGTYLLRIIQDGKTEIQKIIIQRK